jgi:hypothetical protein
MHGVNLVTLESPDVTFSDSVAAMQQTEMAEISNGLPPIVYASAFVLGENIYLVGGSSSPDVQQMENYYQMNDIFYSQSASKISFM